MKNYTRKFTQCCLFVSGALLIFVSTLQSQTTQFRQSSWRLGLNTAWQMNNAGLGWQNLHGTDANFQAPENNIVYVDGTGNGLYAGAFAEYLSKSWWGIQFRVSYDDRKTLITDDTKPLKSTFDTKINYLTFEPLFRADQMLIPNLNFYLGPIIAVNLTSTYAYNHNPNNVTTEVSSATEAPIAIPDFKKVTYGLNGGIGYDINVATMGAQTSFLVTPFVDCSWIVNQKATINQPDQNSIADVWSTVSYRAGLRLSMNFSSAQPVVTKVIPPVTTTPAVVVTKKVEINLPKESTILTKNVRGYFPIHPYVFFEKGSLEIPTRYTTLSKSAATNFKESDLTNFMKGDLTVKETNVNQLMTSYYNVLNIYGDRMRNNPSELLTLRGSDPDRVNGESYANKVKNYLVNNFGISPKRISIIVEDPKKPSGTTYSDPAYAGLIDDENRRVVFVFSNPDMLKSLAYTIRDESSIDNDMIFSIGKDVPFKSWDITISGEGRSMYFGPYAYSAERINPAELMRFLDNGTYNAKVTITNYSGTTSEENVGFKLYKSRDIKNASRYLMLFDYDQSDAIVKYENRIRTEIAPGMEVGNNVIVHGHTDIIGNEAGNQKLSQERAEQAKSIIDSQLETLGKKVDVQAIGIGETQMQYTFDNRYPEGRMYNRNVFVEVIQ